MATDVQQFFETTELAPEEIAARTRGIYQQALRESEYLNEGNFTVIHPDDLRLLFDAYDEAFFAGRCWQLLGDCPLDFRLSPRMTQSAGSAQRRCLLDPAGNVIGEEYAITVATTLLSLTFAEDQGPVALAGIQCRDRLDVLLRVLEHEIIHLVEMLVWRGKSPCTRPRFQSLARRFFGHTEYRHQLITPRKRAFTEFGIKTGDRVAFVHEGHHYEGFVNRITKRATVLVEDQRGQRYSNGKHYQKFYVPVGMLERIEE